MLNLATFNSKNEMMFDDTILFIHIVQKGGLASAVRQLGIPATTMTRRNWKK